MSEKNVFGLKQPNIVFALIKNDAIKNGVSDAIIIELCNAGFRILYTHNSIVKLSVAQTVKFYYKHIGREFFPELLNCLTLGCIPLILEYTQNDMTAIDKLKALVGNVNSRTSPPYTLRGRFGGHVFNPDAPVAENAIHNASDLISTINEIKIVFPELTEISSVMLGDFPLDKFQFDTAPIDNRIKILFDDWLKFNETYLASTDPNKKLGRAFYDHFRLKQSILKDNVELPDLCLKDNEEALELISKLVEFV